MDSDYTRLTQHRGHRQDDQLEQGLLLFGRELDPEGPEEPGRGGEGGHGGDSVNLTPVLLSHKLGKSCLPQISIFQTT